MTSPSKTKHIEGGMIWPRVPVAQSVPQANEGRYPAFSIVGKDKMPMVTTVAPTMPVLAASNIPTRITAMPKPPGSRPNTNSMFFSKSSAMRDFSSIEPINTNRGTANKFWFTRIPKIRFGIKEIKAESNTPANSPKAANSRDTPARVNATGYPAIKKKQTTKNSISGSSSSKTIPV